MSRSFERFFNLGESQDNFDFNNCMYQTKEDGSLINFYYYNDGWRINTRASFGNGEINDSGRTWIEVFREAFPLCDRLDKKYTYAFELCSPYNQIVRRYNRPTVFALSAFEGEVELPFNHAIFDLIKDLGANVVDTQYFSSCEMAVDFLKECERTNPTYEGFVLRDCNNVRIKLKSVSYLHLHRLHNNGNIASPKNLIPLIVDCEIDEILSYFEYLRPEVDKWQNIIHSELQTVLQLWEECGKLNTVKEFALAIKGKTKFQHILFLAYRNNMHPMEYWKSENIISSLIA